MEEEKIERYGEDSEFNAGIATLRRLDEIKKHLDADTADDDMNHKFRHLNSFYNELHCMMSKEKRITLKESDIKISERELQEKTFAALSDQYDKFEKNEIRKNSFRKLLNDWELELRDIEQEHNLNMPMGKDVRWALSTRKR